MMLPVGPQIIASKRMAIAGNRMRASVATLTQRFSRLIRAGRPSGNPDIVARASPSVAAFMADSIEIGVLGLS
jgi:hypothetical protein